MAHPTRGHRSGTYEIQEIVGIDQDDLTITFRHAGAYEPETLRLNAPAMAAARQLLRAMANSVKVGDNGDRDSGWESATTLLKSVSYGRIMLSELAGQGYDSFDDPLLDVPTLRSLYDPLLSNAKRSACWLLARVVRENHPNGKALATALKNTRFRVEETDPFVYEDETAAAIEAAARAVYTARFTAQRELFHSIGFDVDGRAWLRIPVQEVIAWARNTHPDQCGTDAWEPFFGASYEEQVAWAVTHPEKFGYVKHARTSRVVGHDMQEIGRALYPDNVALTAALVLHCLGENSGYNYSVLLEKNVESLIRVGSDEALEHAVKDRNHSQDTRATRLSSIYTPGGITEALAGLTRFSRHHRRHLTNPDGTPATVASRLYVEHTADPAAAKVLDSQRPQSAWRGSPEFDAHWDDSAGPRADVPLRFGALRLVAQARALGEGLKGDVHGHSERTKVHYTSHVLPDYLLNKLAAAAQNDFHDEAVARFKPLADATEGPAAELAAVAPEQLMDLEVSVCTSKGNDPQTPERRCALGIVACFTCPNGYRTADHIPGLLAAVEFTKIVERNDPTEWEDGEASHLRFYAEGSLKEFPSRVVANVRRTTDLRPHILTVTGLYMELRHG
ncbi:hypothetical protein [Actinacidiphila oryziradicis]|uniref:Uncharacterized protein n=1 Tax=Actinacidiphila oryziradicis TaxID=2571141 RepID=A0A4U0SIM0_9ACTN|nr:hypothetical protein [Actinacidiphila oryziradicis]TKA09432.1 hypothetical protein FCI23_22855 [Actinacidiphila oryziradicis]